ncbi:MAG: glycosyltransferase [Albidovulum sp.]
MVAATHLRLVSKGFVPTSGLPASVLRAPAPRHRPARKPLGQILVDMKAVAPENMQKALALRQRQDVRLGDILLTHHWVSEADLMAALANQWGARIVDLVADPPDARLLDQFGAEFCLNEGVMPWRRMGAAIVIATSRPEDFARLRASLPPSTGPVLMALAPERDVHASLLQARQTSLVRQAENRVAEHESCRSLDGPRIAKAVRLPLAAFGLLAVLAPSIAFAVLFGWAFLSLVLCTGLKALAFANTLRNHFGRHDTPPPTTIARLPIVSVMVPLFHEDDIAPRLIARLGRLDYPKELLDILLVVEDDDERTSQALARHKLPRWMRVVTVPAGPIRTKPRALNYALDFCRGSIIGVYDAEDAPDPDQLNTVVRRFHDRGPQVACLQGILDFYNPRYNWLSRCFTIEYAAWFRVMLPGIARLGFVVPLGGTTLFFRRKVLEELGGWDAHNVTEDADLGLRLARHGYRTELIDTVTEEEPNARTLPWIKQRSRWIKGYAMTWAVHMRDPVRLWRDLGTKRFIGVQILFLCSMSQYALAPVLWSFWAIALGLGHPLQTMLGGPVFLALAAIFILSELLNIAVGMWAVRGPKHLHLMAWVPSLHIYFPLGALASYKALWETATRPFFWDKTSHGVLDGQMTEGGTSGTMAQLPLVLENPIFADAPQASTLRPVATFKPLRWSQPAPELIIANLHQAPESGHHLNPAFLAPCGIEFQPCFEGF